MKLKNPLLVVSDLEASKRFYREVLGLRVILDFGANVTPDRRALPANPGKLDGIPLKGCGRHQLWRQ